MNVLQVLPQLRVGGVETGTVDLARELVKLGHKAIVVSAGGELVKELEACGVKHYFLPVHEKSLWAIFKSTRALAEIIRKEEIDIVHARSRAPAWSAFFACRMTAAVFVTTCHGFYSKHPFSYVMGWGKRVIVLSNAIAHRMIHDFNVPHERVRLIARSVSLDKFQYADPGPKRKKVFNVGIIARITPIKGHMDFIKAMHKLSKHVPHLKIWIVGDAPESKLAYKEQLQVLVRRLGLWHCTDFLGVQRDIPGVLKGLDAVVLPTVTQEAFGRAIIEAQACGVPVVATKVGGVVDVIDDQKTGVLVPVSSPQAISEALLKIYKDKDFASSLAKAAYDKLKEKYTLELMVEKTLEVYKEALSEKRALIIKIGSIGDVILSTYAINQIRSKLPANYKISFLVGEKCRDLLFHCPYIEELLVCDFKNRDKGLKGLWRLGKRLRKSQFDMVIDLQNNRTSHLLSYLTLSLYRYGYSDRKFGFLLNRGVKQNKGHYPALEHQFKILEPLGIKLENPRLQVWPDQKDREYIEQFLGSQWLSYHQKLVGINLSASTRWQSKNLPLATIAKVCEQLEQKKIRVVVCGEEKDKMLAENLISIAKNAKVINACGKTSINQLASLIKKCAVFISPDSAPLHIASAAETSFVALFGPTDPKRHMHASGKYKLIRKDLSCSPCYKPHCAKARCMKMITAEEIVEAVEELL
ncbi:MAG: lipopolysaccharide heptosyltransferase II [Candidatus Omnitrophica bacterium]|jgi:lipopolysaccharide heptosyltransferase II|nr:lipopolysaccharide heptosyltransferase II [Candidatus Omnitrophota bacterium]